MDLSLINNLQNNVRLDTEKIKQLLLKNGVDGFMDTPKSQSLDAYSEHHTFLSLDEQLFIIEKETGISVPDSSFFSLFYNLDDGDFKAAYLYGSQFKNYLMIRNPKLKNITNIAKELTSLVPIPLINVYEGKRWSLPKIQVFQDGRVVQESNLVGEEVYSSNFEEQDELEYLDRAKRNIRLFKERKDTLSVNQVLE